MLWRALVVVGLAATGVVVAAVLVRRRPEVQALGSVSDNWIAEHHVQES